MKDYIPILESDGLNDDGIITAEKIFTSRNIPKLVDTITTAVIFFDPLPSEVTLKDSIKLFDFKAASSILSQYVYKERIVLAYSPLGGPAAGGLVEELLAFGIKKIIACGSSGLIGDFDSEKFLIVSKAIRDEGLSYHYLKPSIYVKTDTKLNNVIKKEFTKRNILFEEGITWTTDAFYKETMARIQKRKEQGAVSVEMECASIAAICEYRNVPFSQVLYFSDIVKQSGWSDFLDDRLSTKEKINELILEIATEL